MANESKELFIQLIKDCKQHVSELSASETKYYLYILVNSLKETNNEMTREFLEKLLELVDNLKKIQNLDLNKGENPYSQTYQLYQNLQNIAQTNSFSTKVQIIVLQIGGGIASILLGMIGGLAGGVIGFGRGLWNYEPFKGTKIGFLTGYLFGATAGLRVPKKIFKDELLRQIKYGLDGIITCIDHIQQSEDINICNAEMKPLSKYIEEVHDNIRLACFESDSEFTSFLDSDVVYEINTFKAGFCGGQMLHGYMGHHAYILITINKSEYLIEFTNEPADTSEAPDQHETRSVKGSKIVEMLALHHKLRETNPPTLRFVLTKMKPGENDCFTYINKVLIGTNQDGTCLKRYANMNRIGTAVGFFSDLLSPFTPDFFNKEQNGLTL